MLRQPVSLPQLETKAAPASLPQQFTRQGAKEKLAGAKQYFLWKDKSGY